MRQSWVDQRLQYEHIKEQKKIPESMLVGWGLSVILSFCHLLINDNNLKFVVNKTKTPQFTGPI